jgi:hypothetical protein
MAWSTLILASEASIAKLEPQAVHTDQPWGRVDWPDQIQAAKDDLEIWIERDHPVPSGAADRVRDRWDPDYAWGLTGGAYTDLTSDLSNDTEEDVDLATVFATAATDRLYVGARYEFDGVWLQLLDSVNAAASVLTVSYWGRNQWTSADVTDGTALSGATLAQSGRVTWRAPGDWERRKLNGTAEEHYWVELRVSLALTAGTAVTQILPLRPPKGLRRVATLLALSHILGGLELQSSDPERWRDKADRYREDAIGLYQSIRLPLDLDESGSVSDAETTTRATSSVRLWRG